MADSSFPSARDVTISKPAAPSFREMNLRVFRREPLPHVFFQPRIEPWVQWHQRRNLLPEPLRGRSLPETFDWLGASMRYLNYHTGLPNAVISAVNPTVKVRERNAPDERVRIYETPFGDLTEVQQFTAEGSWRVAEHLVKAPADLAALRWLCERTTYSFSRERFEAGRRFMGDRGEPQFFLPRSPYQALVVQWMTLPDLIYALADMPQEVEDLMRVIDDSYDPVFKEIIASGLVKIAGFGENIEAQLLSPKYFEQYLLPYYQKRVGALRRAGIHSHVHIDGKFRPLLRYLADLPFDGLEALTPAPMGDATLEDIREHIGDKILLDGLPAILFTDTYTRDELMQMVEKMVTYFHPRLILGISDELPQGGGLEAMERCKLVADWCRNHG
jgi:hypothetical protein